MFKKEKIAIVYDWIDKWGGIERVLLIIRELFPNADFYTSYVDFKKAPWAKDFPIHTSFIQNLPNLIKTNRILSLPFYPFAFESFDFNQYRLVLSLSSSFAKSVITKPETIHVSYMLTPLRYIWLYPDYYTDTSFKKTLFSPYLDHLKQWDFVAAQRPDHIISISETVASRCRRYYRRTSEVIYPPFDRNYWESIQSKMIASSLYRDYFLIVSRLEPYKRVDIAIHVFNKIEKYDLVIVGMGSQEKTLKKLAGRNIHFIKHISDEELAGLYRNAEAVIMPQEEDFGYVALEAQFFGCPVIAYRKGGAVETLWEARTGIFFDRQDEKSLANSIERYHMLSYNLKMKTRKYGIRSVLRFERRKFEERLIDVIHSKISL